MDLLQSGDRARSGSQGGTPVGTPTASTSSPSGIPSQQQQKQGGNLTPPTGVSPGTSPSGSTGAKLLSAFSSLTTAAKDAASAAASKVRTMSDAMASSALISLNAKSMHVEEQTFMWHSDEVPPVRTQVNNIDRLRVTPLTLKMLNYGASHELKTESLLASARLDLSTGHDGKPTDFDLELEYGGLPAGRISGVFQLEWEPASFQPLTWEELQAV
jgi:hypothetical protein